MELCIGLEHKKQNLLDTPIAIGHDVLMITKARHLCFISVLGNMFMEFKESKVR